MLWTTALNTVSLLLVLSLVLVPQLLEEAAEDQGEGSHNQERDIVRLPDFKLNNIKMKIFRLSMSLVICWPKASGRWRNRQ